MSKISQTPLQKKFSQIYSRLSQDRKNILKCISIIYDSVPKATLMKCLNQAGCKNNRGKKFNIGEMTPILKQLAKSKLIKIPPGKGLRCNPEIVELTIREAVADKSFEGLAMTVQKEINVREAWSSFSYYQNYNQGIRDIRIAFYRGRNESQLDKILSTVYDQFPDQFRKNHPLNLILFNPLDTAQLHTLPPELLHQFLIPKLNNAFLQLLPIEELLEFVKEYCQKSKTYDDDFSAYLILHAISRGQTQKAHTLIKDMPQSGRCCCYLGWLAFLEGDNEKSLLHYRQGLQLIKKITQKQKVYFSTIAGFFYPVALLQSGNMKNMQEAVDYLALVQKQKNVPAKTMYDDLEQTLLFAMGQRSKAENKFHSLEYCTYFDYISVLLAFITITWQGKKQLSLEAEQFLANLQQTAEVGGYHWFNKEATALMRAYGISVMGHKQHYDKLKKLCPLPDLCTIIKPKEMWEQVLKALSDLHSKDGKNQTTSQNERLVWLLDYDEDYGDCDIVPRLQKLSKNGKWTKGRAVALSRLYSYSEDESLSCLSSQDKNVINSIQKSHSSGYYGGSSSSYAISPGTALPALVDHPLLFLHDNPSIRLELLKGNPELQVLKKKNGYEISLNPPLEEETSFVLHRESPTRLRYIPVSRDHRKVADLIGSSITVPLKAKDKVLTALTSVAKILTIHSDIDGRVTDIRKVSADSRPHVHLLPYKNGLQVEFLCRPFPDGGSYYPPGSGGKTVFAEIDGEQLQTHRNLNSEQKNSTAIVQECPTLQHCENLDNEWILEEPEDCLELLCELGEQADNIVLEWPKGEKLKVTSEASFSQFTMGIKWDNDWFSATGTLKVNQKLTLDMKKLLAMTLGSQSRFIKLDDGTFLALSKEFKRRIEELRAFSENHGNGVRFSPLASLAIEELTDKAAKCTTDKHWKNNLKRFQSIEEPTLPSTLQASLRDYQIDGFKWLGCLSAWQVGACLADDMGLGKTVQALAAILLRAQDGPTLVIAPTSVMMNWEDEARRFAPTLNILYFADGDRQKKLNNLDAFDFVICSYGLLQTEAEILSGVQWQTVVLDEAQAIKNRQTKRSKAAMNLQAAFKIITTGTPIENHLGELWNLFRFINPGLLGSHESFQKKFAVPIEKQKDRTAGNHLKKLIQPFILRRLKGDVLQELPPRTEVTMQVEMSEQEAAMYEAQRQQALEILASAEDKKGSPQHMQVLAEITRLRRFCCNPSLVLPDLDISSSKLKVFTQIAKELLENNHKALVFSQFVGHLALLREQLDKLGISYQYLDGSTSTKQRSKRVKDFQAGKGDLFLISLKAGGSGLNLTAADYVIHMDPWWNPAVEDQASDRAHRIGQQRPVTVYRLVVKDSIEEKIVALHKEKRALADNLLDGSDMSGRMSTMELLKLLKNG